MNAVAPGLLETGISGPGAMGLADASLSRDVPIKQVSKNTALGIVVRPENVVGSYVLLAGGGIGDYYGRVIDLSTVGVPPRTVAMWEGGD